MHVLCVNIFPSRKEISHPLLISLLTQNLMLILNLKLELEFQKNLKKIPKKPQKTRFFVRIF